MKTKPAKQQKAPNLTEYAEEAIPFDTVIRTLAKIKPKYPAVKPKSIRKAPKRK